MSIPSIRQMVKNVLNAAGNGVLVKQIADNLSLTDSPSAGIKTITGTAAEVFAGSSRKEGRSLIAIRNLDNSVKIRVGGDTLTDENGFGVDPGGLYTEYVDPDSVAPIYAISTAGEVEVEVYER